MLIFDNVLDWVAFAWFWICWVSYTLYARHSAKTRQSLSAVLHTFRKEWIQAMMRREQRISDMALLGNLMQMNNFFASTTILVLAGAITVLYSADSVVNLLSGHALIVEPTKEQVQFKLLTLVLIFVFAFFRFTWSMRQHIFCTIVFGAAPLVQKDKFAEAEEEFATYLARISDRAGHEFNYGLRAYYFALALLTWFIHPWLLIPASTFIVLVLYRREFASTTLKYLTISRDHFRQIEKS